MSNQHLHQDLLPLVASLKSQDDQGQMEHAVWWRQWSSIVLGSKCQVRCHKYLIGWSRKHFQQVIPCDAVVKEGESESPSRPLCRVLTHKKKWEPSSKIKARRPRTRVESILVTWKGYGWQESLSSHYEKSNASPLRSNKSGQTRTMKEFPQGWTLLFMWHGSNFLE